MAGTGTIYPDRIESLSITGMTIKSHHNVGGLPKDMKLQLCEPLKWLFKDEVRRVGHQLDMPERLIKRHPFPRSWSCRENPRRHHPREGPHPSGR